MHGTVKAFYVSYKTPLRDSTPVIKTADLADWRICCRTPWWVFPLIQKIIISAQSAFKT